MLYPSACAGIIGSQANKPKPQNQNSSIIINKR
jgi:hypothetical protein